MVNKTVINPYFGGTLGYLIEETASKKILSAASETKKGGTYIN